MATIRTRVDTSVLFIDFRYKGIRYRLQSIFHDTVTNRKLLEKDLKRIEAEIELDILDVNKLFPEKGNGVDSFTGETERFDIFVEQWLNTKRVEWQDSYFEQVTTIISYYLIPTFGSFDLKHIKKREILDFRSNLGFGVGRFRNIPLSASRINHITSTLRMILNDASDQFDFKPTYRNIRALRIPRTNIKPFTLSEIKLILKSVKSNFRPYLTVRFYTGLRSSEINGLKWEYVDFENKQILIRETWINGKVSKTKNDGSTREVTMSGAVYAALKRQQNNSEGNEYVFSNKNHNPIDNGNFTKRVWYPLLERLGFEKRRPYQTRHTTASLWLAAGESPEWIANQLGHTSTNMLFKVYSRFVPNLAKQDGALFENTLNHFKRKQQEVLHAYNKRNY